MMALGFPKAPTIRNAPTRIEIRPPKARMAAKLPRGPELYRQPATPNVQGGPGTPPPGFLSGQLHGSASEWPIYWGLWRGLGCKPDAQVYRAPFLGDPEGKFIYQSYQLGGRSLAFGAVADFEVPGGRHGPTLFLRIQSYRYHLDKGPAIMGYDEIQRERLSEYGSVIDLFEQDFLGLGAQELVIYVKQAIGAIQRTNPLTAGTTRRS
jgi:hypothetical protein